MRALTILYSGSTDGAIWPCYSCSGNPLGGLARRATMVRQLRLQAPDLLLVDAGDLLSARGRVRGDRRVLDIYRTLGYDAVNIGDQELIHGEAFLRTEVLGSGLPLVSASLSAAPHGELLAPPYRVRVAGGVRIGILGVVDAQAFMSVPPAAYRGVRIASVAAAVEPHLAELGSTCDLVIVLSNMGAEGDADLAREVPGIDIIIGAHAGVALHEPLQVDGTLICRPGHGGEYLGRLELRVDGAGRIATWQHELMPVSEAVPADSAVVAAVRELQVWEAGSQKEMVPSVQTGRLHTEIQRCADCHVAAAVRWQESRHARAYSELPPDMQGNLGCLPCHATGWAKGGYIDAARTPDLQNVGCTACHHVPRRHLSWPTRAPVAKVTAEVCLGCHTEEYTPGFDFGKYWALIRH